MLYFDKNPIGPFDENGFTTEREANQPTPSKKRKATNTKPVVKYTDDDIVLCSYTFLKYNAEYVREKWNWSAFVEKYLKVEPSYTKW